MRSIHDHRNSPTDMYTYLDSQNGQQGPFSLNQLFSWCAAGQMPPTTMVRLHKPNETFRALLDVPGFSTWVRPFAQTWHSLAQHKQQQLPPPQLTPPHQWQWLPSPPPPPPPQKLVALAAAPATPTTPATPATAASSSGPSAATTASAAATPQKPVAGSKVVDLTEDTEPPTPATAPRPTVPSKPDAQLPESFADYVKAMKADMSCPVCRRGFATFNGTISHLIAKGDAVHVAWRSQNAELVAQLRVERDKKPTPAEALAIRQEQERERQRQRLRQRERQQEQ